MGDFRDYQILASTECNYAKLSVENTYHKKKHSFSLCALNSHGSEAVIFNNF